MINKCAWFLSDLKSIPQNGIKVFSTFACGGGSTFPDDYKAKSENIGKYMVGMSVPPKMTYEVAKAVCEQWLGVNYG